MRETPFRCDTVQLPGGGYGYRIFDGDEVICASGPFLLERDAANTGRRFASDADLKDTLNR